VNDKVVVVLGAPRSATSAAAKGMHLAGFPMGDNLIRANRSNPYGHYEDSVLVALNDRLLHACGGSWDSPPRWPKPKRAHVDEAVEYIAGRGKPPWGCKDPRMVLIWPIWAEAFERFRFDLILVKTWRNPTESAASLMRRDGTSMENSGRVIAAYHDRLGRIGTDG
jgi:hypothetical protein